jgi:hypothetical protein
MDKQLEVKKQAAVGAALDAWGDTPKLNTNDIIIAKILPMQGLSQLVSDGKAMMGEFRDSLTGTKLGSIAEPFEVLPFHVEKYWDIMEEDGSGNYKWVKSEPLVEDPAIAGYNDNLPWNDEVNGAKIKRVRRMNFYVMLPSEIEQGSDIPYILSFKSTSYREGKKVYTQMYMRNRRASLPPPGFLFKIAGVKQKNDKGTFIVPTVELSRRATEQEITSCLAWYKLVKKGTVKVDDSDMQETTSAAEVGFDTPAEESTTGAF